MFPPILVHDLPDRTRGPLFDGSTRRHLLALGCQRAKVAEEMRVYGAAAIDSHSSTLHRSAIRHSWNPWSFVQTRI